MKFIFSIIPFVLLVSCQTSKTNLLQANIHHGIFKGNKDQVAEICPELTIGQTLSFNLKANLPVLFNFHYHQGKNVNYPIPEKNLTEIQHQFTAPENNTYCLMWKTHLTDTKVKYQYQIN